MLHLLSFCSKLTPPALLHSKLGQFGFGILPVDSSKLPIHSAESTSEALSLIPTDCGRDLSRDVSPVSRGYDSTATLDITNHLWDIIRMMFLCQELYVGRVQSGLELEASAVDSVSCYAQLTELNSLAIQGFWVPRGQPYDNIVSWGSSPPLSFTVFALVDTAIPFSSRPLCLDSIYCALASACCQPWHPGWLMRRKAVATRLAKYSPFLHYQGQVNLSGSLAFEPSEYNRQDRFGAYRYLRSTVEVVGWWSRLKYMIALDLTLVYVFRLSWIHLRSNLRSLGLTFEYSSASEPFYITFLETLDCWMECVLHLVITLCLLTILSAWYLELLLWGCASHFTLRSSRVWQALCCVDVGRNHDIQAILASLDENFDWQYQKGGLAWSEAMSVHDTQAPMWTVWNMLWITNAASWRSLWIASDWDSP